MSYIFSAFGKFNENFLRNLTYWEKTKYAERKRPVLCWAVLFNLSSKKRTRVRKRSNALVLKMHQLHNDFFFYKCGIFIMMDLPIYDIIFVYCIFLYFNVLSSI
jgi:hypothetical protein